MCSDLVQLFLIIQKILKINLIYAHFKCILNSNNQIVYYKIHNKTADF